MIQQGEELQTVLGRRFSAAKKQLTFAFAVALV
jgi:hypothetical protein